MSTEASYVPPSLEAARAARYMVMNRWLRDGVAEEQAAHIVDRELVALRTELALARRRLAALDEATELERYPEQADGRRQWASHASTWLYPGDRIVIIRDAPLNPPSP